MCLSLTTGAGGAWLVKFANAIPAPNDPTPRALTGTVTDILVQPCGNRNRRANCQRPVVNYTDISGQPQQLVSRTGYSPTSPLRKGERATVYVEKTGAWLALEWDARQARRQREYEDRRGFPLVMGWLLAGCGALGVLLGAGLIFWVDRTGSA
jgi:hypothetical protein